MSAQEILVPLLNANEPLARVVGVAVREGQWVEAGATLCELETTKATLEVAAPAAGYVRDLHAERGAMLLAGELLCSLAESPSLDLPASPPVAPADHETTELRLTAPARRLLRELATDDRLLARLPRDRLLTSDDIRDLLQPAGPRAWPPAAYARGDAVLVYGGGRHARVLLDLLAASGELRAVAVVDDTLAPGSRVHDLPVLGGRGALSSSIAQGPKLAVNAVAGLEDLRARWAVFELLARAGFGLPALRHISAVVEEGAHIADGAQVLAQAYIGSLARVGRGAIVNTRAVVSHHSDVGDGAHLAPGAILAGGVIVGEVALVGMGAQVALDLRVGVGARIGNGAVVNADVPDGAIVPAGSVWPARGRLDAPRFTTGAQSQLPPLDTA